MSALPMVHGTSHHPIRDCEVCCRTSIAGQCSATFAIYTYKCTRNAGDTKDHVQWNTAISSPSNNVHDGLQFPHPMLFGKTSAGNHMPKCVRSLSRTVTVLLCCLRIVFTPDSCSWLVLFLSMSIFHRQHHSNQTVRMQYVGTITCLTPLVSLACHQAGEWMSSGPF